MNSVRSSFTNHFGARFAATSRSSAYSSPADTPDGLRVDQVPPEVLVELLFLGHLWNLPFRYTDSVTPGGGDFA